MPNKSPENNIYYSINRSFFCKAEVTHWNFHKCQSGRGSRLMRVTVSKTDFL